jgi:hypothetical protein
MSAFRQRRQTLQDSGRRLPLFLKHIFFPAANDNAPRPGPEPAAAALAVPANDNNDNADAHSRRNVLVLGAVAVFATTGGLAYLKTTFLTPYEPTGPFSPDTKLASLDEMGRRYLIAAMIRQEGTGRSTIAYRAKNPGNINYGAWARKHGAIGSIRGIAVFRTFEDGVRAMEQLIFGVYSDRTIYTMLAGDPAHGIRGYAPEVVDQFRKLGNPRLYAAHVAKWMNGMQAKDKLLNRRR